MSPLYNHSWFQLGTITDPFSVHVVPASLTARAKGTISKPKLQYKYSLSPWSEKMFPLYKNYISMFQYNVPEDLRNHSCDMQFRTGDLSSPIWIFSADKSLDGFCLEHLCVSCRYKFWRTVAILVWSLACQSSMSSRRGLVHTRLNPANAGLIHMGRIIRPVWPVWGSACSRLGKHIWW